LVIIAHIICNHTIYFPFDVSYKLTFKDRIYFPINRNNLSYVVYFRRFGNSWKG